MISIIVPFYNTEKYIEECLRSIKSQTFSDFECLIIDDGSTDNSRQIVQKFVDEDSRFKLLNKEHIGYPICKNLGLDNAKGDYICFIDSDDFIEPDYLKILYNNLIDTNSDISCCRFNNKLEFYSNQQTNNVSVYSNTLDIFTKYFNNSYPWVKLYKKELFNNLRYKNVEALSDTILLPYVFERAKKTVYSDYLGYHYRVHNESITYNVRNYSDTYWPFRLNVYIEICSYLIKYQELSRILKNILRGEYLFCLSHLTKEQIEEFNNKEEVKYLLNSKNIV